MEKIYVEEKQTKDNSNFKQVMGSKVPHHFSIILILVAFASFLTIGLRSHQSYAITEDELMEFYTTKTGASGTIYRDVVGKTVSEEYEYQVPYSFARTEEGGVSKDLTDVQLFCVNKEPGLPNGSLLYKRTDEKVDKGIIYILSQHNAADKANLGKYTKTWITQTAIWMYQKQYLGMYANYAGLNANVLSAVEAQSTIQAKNTHIEPQVMEEEDNPGVNLYEKYIAPLIEAAHNAPNNLLNVTSDNNVTVTNDNKYYKSSIVTVTGLNAGSTYSITLTNAPEGTKVYKENGEEITDLNNVNANDNKFYLLAPIDKVTEKTKSVTVSITGDTKTAYVYKAYNANGSEAQGEQPITTLVDAKVNTGVDINYKPNVPDTSMNAAQSIYFIGLVILLCGLGIIYANAKPKVTEE